MRFGSWRRFRTGKNLKRLLPGLTGLALLAVTILTPASGWSAEFEMTPIVGYTFGGGFENSVNGEELNFAETESYGFVLDLEDKTKPGGNYELLFLRQPTHLRVDNSAFSGDSKFDVDINYLHLGGSYGQIDTTLNPYVAAGIGLTHMDPERGDAETRFSFSIGGGVKIPLTRRIALRLEGRGFATLFNGQGSIFCVENSCEIQVRGDLLWQFTTFSGIVMRF